MTIKKTPKKTVKKAEAANGLQDVIKNINNQFGEEAVIKLGDKEVKNIPAVSTGSVGLDIALGVGGLPRGRVVELYGPEASGKTTLALNVIAQAQKNGEICAFIDAEHALDADYSKRVIGVDTENLLISQPNTGEEALEITDSLIRSGKVGVIVVDSVAALTPRQEIEGEMNPQKYIGVQARLMGLALRKIIGAISKTNTIVIFINQIRMQVGITFGNPEITPGGKALKFASSVRLDIRRIQQIKKGDEVVGGRIRVKVVKNKVAPPFRSTEFDLLYKEGLSVEGELLALGEKFGFINKSGASFSYGKIKLGRGYDAARKKLKEEKALLKQLKEEVIKALKDN